MQFIKILLAGCCLMAAVAQAETSGKNYPLGERSLFSDRAIAERVKPSASICLEGDACATAVPVVIAAASTGPMKPEALYNQTCKTCHGTGMMGAPKFGSSDWKPRAAKGMDTLVKHAMSGFNAMPPKGTCGTCSEADIRGAVKYMVDHSK